MIRSINFLNARSRHRVNAVLGRVRARLTVYGVAAGFGCAILLLAYVGARMQVQNFEGQEQLLRVTQTALDQERARDNAALDTRVGDVDPLLPRLDTIRNSGPGLADRLARTGNMIPVGSWLDKISEQGDGTVTVNGGVRNLTRLASLLSGLSATGVDPHLKTSQPQQGEKVYLSYEVSAGPAVAEPTATPAATMAPFTPGPSPSPAVSASPVTQVNQ
jgi:Tfp pilus assembly protein PilN